MCSGKMTIHARGLYSPRDCMLNPRGLQAPPASTSPTKPRISESGKQGPHQTSLRGMEVRALMHPQNYLITSCLCRGFVEGAGGQVLPLALGVCLAHCLSLTFS